MTQFCPHCQAPLPTSLNLHLDHAEHLAFRNGQAARLTKKEFEVLEKIASRNGKFVTTEAIIISSWHRAELPEEDWIEFPEQILRVIIHRLRKKIAPLNLRIKSVYGSGYRLEVQPAEGPVV